MLEKSPGVELRISHVRPDVLMVRCRLSSVKTTLLKQERVWGMPMRKQSDIINSTRDVINAKFRAKLTDLDMWADCFADFAAAIHTKTGRLSNCIGFIDGKVSI